MLQHGGLSHLPRPCNKDCLKKIAHVQELPLKLSLDVLHSILQMRNHKLHFIFSYYIRYVKALFRLPHLQPEHLSHHSVSHLYRARQHKQVEDQLAHIRPHHRDGACAYIHHRLA